MFEELDLALMDMMMRMDLDGKSEQPNSAIFERSVWPFLQPKIELLWNNLNKLKSTLHLTLNVLIYARQVAEKYVYLTSFFPKSPFFMSKRAPSNVSAQAQ